MQPYVGVWLRLAGVPSAERAQIAASVGARGHPRLAVGAAPDEATRWGYRAVHLPGALLGAARPADLADFAWSTCAVHDEEQLAAAAAVGVTLAWLSPVADVPSKGRVALADDARSALLSAAKVPLGALGGVTPSNAARWYAAGFAALATFGSWPTVGLSVWPRRSEASDVAGQGASR